MFGDDPGERHRQIVAKREIRLPARLVFTPPQDLENEFVALFAVLAEQRLDVLERRRLERLDKVARAAWTPQSPAARATDTALDPPPTAGLVRLLLSLGLEADALNELRYAQRRWP